MNVAEYTIDFLQKKGIKRIYGVTGGAIMYFTEAIRKSSIEFISTLHEQGAGIAAEAESIYNNSPAVLLTTNGPGIMNAITPITSAWIDGNPLLVLSGQCKTADSMIGTDLRQKGIQEVNALKILSPIIKYGISLRRQSLIKNVLEEAYYEMLDGRHSPVFIEFFLDIQNVEVDENETINTHFFHLKLNYETATKNYDLDITNKINKLIEFLNNSKKPVILAGNGIRQANALEQFKELVNQIRIPVLLTWKSLDFLTENNSLNFGRPGLIASRYANKILQECDLLISIGARFDFLIL